MNCSKISFHLLIIICLLSGKISAQNFNFDSFELVISKIKSSKDEITAYNEEAEDVRSYDFHTSLSMFQKALELAQKEKYLKGQIDAHLNIGIVYSDIDNIKKAEEHIIKAYKLAKINKNEDVLATVYNALGYLYEEIRNYDNAIKYFKLAEKLNLKLNNQSRLAGNYTNLGMTYSSMGNLLVAMDYYFKAARIYETFDKKISLAVVYNNIAIVKADLNHFPDAIKYYLQAAELNKQNNNLIDLASNYNNIAVVYKELHDYNNAINYYNKAIKINEQTGVKSSLAQNFMNLAVLIGKQGDYEQSLLMHNKSLAMCSEIDLDLGKVYNYLNMSEMYLKLKKYKETEYYLDQSAILLNENEIPDLKLALNKNYYSFFKEVNNYQKALFYYEKFTTLEDSIYSQEAKLAIHELEKKYETEKTERENELLKEQNRLKEKTIKNQKLLWIATSAVLILFIILTIVSVNSRRKQHINMQKLIQLNKDNLEKTSQLAELNVHKDRFFSIIAHDLKNPFHLLLGYSELMNMEMKSKHYDDIETYSNLISKCAKTGNDLLDNLMEWSRSQRGKIVISQQTLLLKDIIEKSIGLLNRNAVEKNITINNLISDTCQIYADLPTINTVLRNLLANAIKFTHANGEINLYCSEKPDQTIICVKDNGIGIAPEDIPKLFSLDKDFTTPGTEDERGSGLGLVICKEFVEQNGGELIVDSTPNVGSTFSVVLKKV